MDRPEVFTRERLVDRRVTEVQFYEQKLAAPYTPTLQGYNDVREFSGFYQSLSAQFDPLGGTLAASQKGAQISQVNRDNDLAGLQQKVDKLKLQQEYAALKANGSSGAANNSSGGQTTANANNYNTSGAFGDVTLPTANSSDYSLFNGSNHPALIDTSSTVKSNAQLTGIESLRDEVAYRDAVQAMMREKELDDTHDLLGYTLYTLKFDITTNPADENGKLGVVKLNVLADPDTNPLTHYSNDSTGKIKDLPETQNTFSMFQNWRSAFIQSVQAETIALQNRLGIMGKAETVQLATELADAKQDALQDEFVAQREGRNASSAYSTLSNNSTQFLTAMSSATPLAQTVNKLAVTTQQDDFEKCRLIVEHRYKSIVDRGLIKFLPRGVVVDETRNVPGLFTLNIDNSSSADRVNLIEFKAFLRVFDQIRARHAGDRNSSGYVYSVEPKEYAQNISDVAAAEKMSQFVLALEASLPQYGVKAGSYTNAMNDSQQRLQEVMRKPLVVGFGDGQSSFGWVLGPRFKIGHDFWGSPKIDFEQTHVQQSVQATLAVPAYLPSIQLTGTYKWQHSDGSGKAIDLFNASNKTITIDLPADPAALTRAMLGTLGIERQSPIIEAALDDSAKLAKTKIAVTGPNSPVQTILIRGSDLWRNPKVFIGSQQASHVSVLPDMRGLLAEFATVNAVPGSPADGQDVDLSVITSQGISTVQGAVRIVTVNPSASLQVKAAVATPFVVQTGAPLVDPPIDKLHITVDPTSMPKGYFAVSVRVRQTNNIAWNISGFTPVSKSPDGTDLVFAAASPPPVSADFVTDLQIKSNPDADPVSIPLIGNGAFVFYARETDREPSLVGGNITLNFNGPNANASNPALLQLSLPPDPTSAPGLPTIALFDHAFPDYETQATAGKVMLTLSAPGVASFSLPLSRAAGTALNVSSMTNLAIPPSASSPQPAYNASIGFVTAAGKQVSIPVQGSLTIKQSKP